jgi:NADPH:quinone reductase-like Zn-dependent oxidoreductase
MPYLRTDIKNGQGPTSSLFMASDIEKPIPSRGQALVQVKYFGLNRQDITHRNGQYPVPPQAGKILSVEFSGAVARFGDETQHKDGFEIGDEVFGLAYGGKPGNIHSARL